MGLIQESHKGSGFSRLQKILDSITRSECTATRLPPSAFVAAEVWARSATWMWQTFGPKTVRTGVIELVKVLGSDNPADIMTKYTDRPILEKMLAKMNMHALPGRAACAPAAAGC